MQEFHYQAEYETEYSWLASGNAKGTGEIIRQKKKLVKFFLLISLWLSRRGLSAC